MKLLALTLSVLISSQTLFAKGTDLPKDRLSASDGSGKFRSYTLAELKSKVKTVEVEILEPENGKKQKYLALPFDLVLDEVLGKKWQERDDIMFTCADGYQPVTAVQTILEKKPLLAYGIPGKKDFAIYSAVHKKAVNLSPFYLIWNNTADPALQTATGLNWPFQLVGVETVSFKQKFPKLAPPAGSAKEVARGFIHYRTHCMTCHTLNGEGGTTANLELNQPVSVTEYWKKDWLEKWILDPTQVRSTSKMSPYEYATPGKTPSAETRQEVKDIIAYLEAMAPTKQNAK